MNIDKNIPMPSASDKSSELQSAVRQMNVGDSVFLRGYKNRAGASAALVGTAYRLGLPFKFTSAVEGDGFRVWRKA